MLDIWWEAFPVGGDVEEHGIGGFKVKIVVDFDAEFFGEHGGVFSTWFITAIDPRINYLLSDFYIE